MENQNNNQWTCGHCGGKFDSEVDSTSLHNGEIVCESCLGDHYSYCEESGEYYPADEIILAYKLNNSGNRIDVYVHQDNENYVETVNGEFWHEHDTYEVYYDSLRNTKRISKREYETGEYFTCDDCGDIFHYDYQNSINGGDRHVCENCLNSGEYEYCNSCDEWHYSDSDCFNSDDDDNCSLIHNYSFTPKLNFKGKNNKLNPFVGFELEVESKNGSKNEQAETITDSLGSLIYLKNDGSLNNGFEIVSHPMTLDVHKENGYLKAFDELSKAGAKSHDTSTCGLHFHLDKRQMTDTHKVRFGTFFALQKNKLEILARRTSSQYARFKDKKLSDKKDYTKNSDRYEAVNWQNSDTVEIRIFKGTLKFETFMASMELCHAIYNFTQIRQAFCTLNDNQLWNRFTKFVSKNSSQYSNLVQYLETKKELLNKAIKLDDLEAKKDKIESEIKKVNSSMTLNELETA
jgi:hypothetical protein